MDLSNALRSGWSTNANALILTMITLVALPILINIIIYWLSRYIQAQMDKTFGNNSQVVIGGLGNVLHEAEELIIAKLGGHHLNDTEFVSWHDLRHFKRTVSVNHNWLSHNLYQSLFAFFLGTMPVYLTGLFLWGVQTLLGGNTFKTELYHPDYFGLVEFKNIFLNSLATAFSAGSWFEHIVFFLIVLLIASTAFFLSYDDFLQITSGVMVWVIVLVIVWGIFAIFGFSASLNNIIWLVMSVSAFLLAHVLVYIIVILIIVSIFHVLNRFDF